MNEEKDNTHEESKVGTVKPRKDIWGVVAIIFIVILVVILFYAIQSKIPELKLPDAGEKTNLVLLFAAGLLTGFHCIAMCGGFVVSYTAKNLEKGHKGFTQHLVYGGSKVVSYTVIGAIFGLIGGAVAFSVGLRGWVAILAGAFMVFYSLSMFGLKFFRKFQFNPKFLSRFASKESGKFSGPYSRPLVTGLLNGLFIACGPLQAMYLYAVGTGSVVSGAASLFAFGLGTLPVMIGFGSFASVISSKTTGKILKISAVIVLILGLIMLNRGLDLTGSKFSYNSIKAGITGASGANSVGVVNGVQEINMQVDASGYSPNSFVLQKNVPVKWNVNVVQLTGCNQELVMSAYKIDVKLKQGLNVINFTPDKTGTITFTCGMGMLRGSFIVTDNGKATSQQLVSAAPTSSGGSCGMSSGTCGCGM